MGNYDEYKEICNLKNIPGNFVASFIMRTNEEILAKVLAKTLTGLTEATMSAIESNNMAFIEEWGMTVEEFLDIYLDDMIVLFVLIAAVGIGLVRQGSSRYIFSHR